jgi:uncharacterized alkaline shock family protein YloU
MKAFHLLLGVVLLAVALAAGLFVVSTALQGAEAWSLLLDGLKERQLEVIVTSLGLIFVLLLYALTAFRLPEKQQFLAYDIEGGNVSISLQAVQNFLGRLAQEFAAVDDLSPTVRARQGTVDVQLDVRIKAGAQIPELCRMLQERARTILSEKVGISDVREVRVRVQEITGSTAAGETAAGDHPAFT